jgi:hypothetical protein
MILGAQQHPTDACPGKAMFVATAGASHRRSSFATYA